MRGEFRWRRSGEALPPPPPPGGRSTDSRRSVSRGRQRSASSGRPRRTSRGASGEEEEDEEADGPLPVAGSGVRASQAADSQDMACWRVGGVEISVDVWG